MSRELEEGMREFFFGSVGQCLVQSIDAVDGDRWCFGKENLTDGESIGSACVGQASWRRPPSFSGRHLREVGGRVCKGEGKKRQAKDVKGHAYRTLKTGAADGGVSPSAGHSVVVAVSCCGGGWVSGIMNLAVKNM